MPGKSSRGGGIISRKLRRIFDERDEMRFDGDLQRAVLTRGTQEHAVEVGNISSTGAMVVYAEPLDIGERVTLQLLDHGAVAGQVRWVRDGHVGINFTTPLE